MLTDLEKARALFLGAGLAFPVLPKELASSLKEFGLWCYSTRPLKLWPYDLDSYVQEAGKDKIYDYALLSHLEHGVNSYAIQYYLIYGSLRMLIFLGWGGVYMDNQKKATQIQECFSLADQITKEANKKLVSDKLLMIVVSDFYGSYWSPDWKSGIEGRRQHLDNKTPKQVLIEVLNWISSEK